MPAEKTWHSRWLSLAFEVASWSKDPSTHHGCVLTINNRPISFGYNGMAEGTDDAILHTKDKYESVVHAETNALFSAARCGHRTDGAIVYVTGQPCPNCLGSLINAGIKKLVYHPLWTNILSEDDHWFVRSQAFHNIAKDAKLEIILHECVSSLKHAFFKGKAYTLEVNNLDGL